MIERPTRRRHDTLHVNLFGSPGTGKSPLGHKIVALLCEAGCQAVLVQDYAAELSLQGKLAWREAGTGEVREFDQFLISSEQYRRQSEMDGLAEVVVTESPLLQQLVFAPGNYAAQLLHIINELTVGWSSLDVLLQADIRADYRSLGRIQGPQASMALQGEIRALLQAYRGDFIEMRIEGAAHQLYDLVIERISRARTGRTHA